MKDFPVFITENGVASLILKEVPYQKKGYIRIQNSQDPLLLLEECISFCRICGAEYIYATGDACLEQFQYYTSVFEMRGQTAISEENVPNMFPVTDQNVGTWRTIYNDRMRGIDNASTLEKKDEAEILKTGGAYYVHDRGILYGIGWLDDTNLLAVAAVKSGGGEMVCRAMQSLIPNQLMTLQVASSNQKAVTLYERMGFIKTKVLSQWYRVY